MCEFPEAYSMVIRTARKRHKCCECRGTILPGEKYHYHSGIWAGEPASFKVCPDCDALRSQVEKDCELFPEEVPGLGCLGNDLEGDHREIFSTIRAKRGAVKNSGLNAC